MMSHIVQCQFQKRGADRHDITAELTATHLVVRNNTIKHTFPCANLLGKIKMAQNKDGTYFIIKDVGTQFALQFPPNSSPTGLSDFTTALVGQGLLANPPASAAQPIKAPVDPAASAGFLPAAVKAGAAGGTAYVPRYTQAYNNNTFQKPHAIQKSPQSPSSMQQRLHPLLPPTPAVPCTMPATPAIPATHMGIAAHDIRAHLTATAGSAQEQAQIDDCLEALFNPLHAAHAEMSALTQRINKLLTNQEKTQGHFAIFDR
jgi:hypothetical protein